MNRTFSLGGGGELSDKTKYESIKVLNQALLERLGEVTGLLNEARAYINRIKRVFLFAIDDISPEHRDQIKAYVLEHVDDPEIGSQREPGAPLAPVGSDELKPSPAEKAAQDP
jgi:hypothetical protein